MNEFLQDISALRRALVPNIAERALDYFANLSQERLMEDWEEDASQAALDDNPTKAHYIETHWLGRFNETV